MSKTLTYYEQNSDELAQRYESAEVSLLCEDLKDTFKDSSHLLEIGCGSGRDASFLTMQGKQVCCVDGSEAMLKKVAQLHPEVGTRLFKVALPEPLPFEDSFFDGAYSVACLMHLKSDEIEIVLKEIRRVVRTGAKVFISVPLCCDTVDSNGIDENGRTFTLLKKAEWQNLFENAGLVPYSYLARPDGLNRPGRIWTNWKLKA
jgi:SAM-dependent methyltransferase